MHQIEPESESIATDDNSLYPYVNNDIKYGLFEDIVDSYYLDSQITDDFQCNHDCYSQYIDLTNDSHSNACIHGYHHITQSVQDLTDSTQQNNLHSMEENASSFVDDTNTHCDFSIIDHNSDTKNTNTPVHTGGGLITSHFWLEIPLKLQHQTIQIKALVCDSECPYDLILG